MYSLHSQPNIYRVSKFLEQREQTLPCPSCSPWLLPFGVPIPHPGIPRLPGRLTLRFSDLSDPEGWLRFGHAVPSVFSAGGGPAGDQWAPLSE